MFAIKDDSDDAPLSNEISVQCDECLKTQKISQISQSTDEGDVCIYCDPDLTPSDLKPTECWSKEQAYLATRVCGPNGAGPDLEEWGDDALTCRHYGPSLAGDVVDVVNQDDIALRDLYIGDDGQLVSIIQYVGYRS